MSRETARAFHEQIKTDKGLAKKIADHAQAGDLSDDVMVKLAAEAGFTCTVADLDAFGLEVANELNEKALDAVVGGAGTSAAGPVKTALADKPQSAIAETPQAKTLSPNVQSLTYSADLLFQKK